MSSHQFVTLFTWDTVLSADSTEWCPISPLQNVFVCGTYQVKESGEIGIKNEEQSPTISRYGTINVFKISSTQKIEPHQVLEVSAVLDMKWCPARVNGKVLLGVATAMGELKIYELEDDCQLKIVATDHLPVEGTGEILALSLDWSAVDTDTKVAVSDSMGRINLFQLDVSFSLKCICTWKSHEYEAWITSFNHLEPTHIFSGGDDSKLRGWDTRQGLNSPTFTSSIHGAGVTSLHCNPQHRHILASGSYDEHLRLWDLRHIKQPLCTTNLHGGVWRLKWDPHCNQHLLAACMYGGFNVVSCSDMLLKSGEVTHMASYKNHESIAYGADWSYLRGSDLSSVVSLADVPQKEGDGVLSLVSTCSFYDHRLCISVIKSDEKYCLFRAFGNHPPYLK